MSSTNVLIKRFKEPASRKPRMYQGLWELIARNKSDEPVKVDCPINNQARLIMAVRKEKRLANRQRKDVDAVTFGTMIVEIDPNNPRTVMFSLDWNGDMI